VKYDPNSPVDPKTWGALDESEKGTAVAKYHRRLGIHPPNAAMHTIVHVIVENQIALGDEFPAEAVLKRLISEGLNRHEAVHAIGSVVADHIFHTLRGPRTVADPNAEYIEKLRNLTADSWKKMNEEKE